eukprot:5432090-Prymnesium_polylepis.1
MPPRPRRFREEAPALAGYADDVRVPGLARTRRGHQRHVAARRDLDDGPLHDGRGPRRAARLRQPAHVHRPRDHGRVGARDRVVAQGRPQPQPAPSPQPQRRP